MHRLNRCIARQMKNPAFRKRVEQEVAELEVGILIGCLRQSLKMNQTELAARAGMIPPVASLRTGAHRCCTMLQELHYTNCTD